MEQNNLPLVSIIITSYNRSKLIGKAIESALMQDYPNLEIVISDNCSTDNTDEVIQKYTSDKRIKYFRNSENIGMLGNFKKATYEYSAGEYITYVNSDDYLTEKSFVTDAVDLVNKYEDVVLVYGRMYGENTENGVFWEMPQEPYFVKEIWDGKDVFFQSLHTHLLSWGACLMKREAMIKVNSLHVDYYNLDIDSNYKMMLGHKVAFLNRLYYLQLGHAGNNGFPVDAEKIINSFRCYENVAKYAQEIMPEESDRITGWKNHIILFMIKWAFHHLRPRSAEQYRLFKLKVKNSYPEHYRHFITSRSYFSLLLQPVKRILPRKLISLTRKMR